MADEGGGASATVEADTVNGHTEDLPRMRPPNEERIRGRMSAASKSLIDQSNELLGLTPSVAFGAIPSPLGVFARPHAAILKSRSSSPDSGNFSNHSAPEVPRLNPMPTFKRIDFDDRTFESVEDKKPAWKQLQDSIKDSYYQAKKSADRTKDESEFLESTYLSRARAKRGESPFGGLEHESFLPRSRYLSSSALGPRVASSNSVSNLYTGTGPYAAPAVDKSQGIESRYDQRVNEHERQMMRSTCLPSASMRSITMKEFRQAPAPAAGSSSEQDDYDFSMYTPRPYYSRPTRGDPDYFDFDLGHSVDMYRRPEGTYQPRRPQEWESKLLAESSIKGSAPLSGHLFKRDEADWRTTNSSLLSAALRTPKFWEQRFESIGQQVRDSNPISLESINRRRRWLSENCLNRPVKSRFTEYRDPDYEDYDDDNEE